MYKNPVPAIGNIIPFGLFFAFSFLCLSFMVGQTLIITGTITDEKTGEPIEYANVFLAHSTSGTTTQANGSFQLKVDKLQALSLVVSHISYNTVEMALPRDRAELSLNLQMQPKEHVLQPLDVVNTKVNRDALLATFKETFFGNSKFGYKCRIENPDVLDFRTQGLENFPSWQFTATSYGPLVYTNKALGYRVSYTLVDFFAGYYHITYFGYPLYTDMLAEMPNEQRILKNREKAFLGSKMHFFRSLLTKTLEQEGFEVYKVDLFVKDSSDVKNYGLMEDSVFIGSPGVVMLQSDRRLDIEQYVYVNFATGIPELIINEPFEIRYTRSKEPAAYLRNPQNFNGMSTTWGAQTSIVKLKEGKLNFYPNGSVDNASTLMTIGYWSFKRMGELLPYDFKTDFP